MSDKERIEKVSKVPEIEEIEEATETDKKNVLAWAFYDLANTIYSMVIVSLIIGKYVLVVGQKGGMQYGDVSFIWGIVQMVMQISVAICVPILGAFSDNAGKRKPFVISLTGIILLFASLIGFFQNLALVLLFFVIANVAYQFSLTFYDAMLPFIAKREDRESVAGFGVAWGYLGTIIALVVVLPLMMTMGDLNSIPPDQAGDPLLSYGYAGTPWAFIIPMLLFLGFSIPFFFVREKQKKGKMPSIGTLVGNSLRQVRSTFKDIRNHKPMFLFIIGYFFVADIANVIVAYMMQLVTDGLIIGQDGDPSDIFGTLFIIIATISAVAFTYFVGKFGKYGKEHLGFSNSGKNTFYLVGFLWGISLIIGIILIFAFPYINIGLNAPFIMSLLVGILAGPALGGTWTAARIMVMELAPKDKFGEYFGFSKLSGKISSAMGPILIGSILLTYDYIGKYSYGWALIALGIVMLIGIIIISRVQYPEKEPKLE